MKTLDVKNLWTWLAVVVIACVLYQGNTEFREHRVATVMKERERIADKWPSEEVYLKQLEPISVDYCPAEFKAVWHEYLDLLRADSSPAGQAKKAEALARGQTADPVEECLHKLLWTARGYGFISHDKVFANHQ